MTGQLITLPDRDETSNRLVAVSGAGHLVRHFYPRLIENAGATVSPTGFVVLMNLAVEDYANSHGPEDKHGPGMTVALLALLGNFTRALVDDEAARILVYEVFEFIGVSISREA